MPSSKRKSEEKTRSLAGSSKKKIMIAMPIIDIIHCKVRDKCLSRTINNNDKSFKPDNTDNNKLRFFSTTPSNESLTDMPTNPSALWA